MNRIRPAELHAVARGVVSALLKQGFVKAKADAAVLERRVAELINETFEQAQALEAEAEKLAATHARQMFGMDQRRVIQGIMERLARERDFPL